MPRFPRLAAMPVVLALSGLMMTAPLHAQTAIRAVTLSTAGLAMIEAEGPLGADPLRLSIARSDIDDFLKSLMVMDPSGAVVQVTLTGPGSFEDAFAHLPVGPGDVTDPARLLASMVGAPVAVERRGERHEGVILGVSQRPAEHGPVPVLSLRQTDGTIRSIELGDAVTFDLTDPADQAVLDAALAALRQGANPRRVSVALDSNSDDGRDAGLVWLQNAPLWRTAWRAVDGPEGLRLIGWAVVENTTGMDWDGVRLTLATGAIRAIEAQLYARAYARREVAQVIAPPPSLASPMARSAVGAPAPAFLMDSLAETAPAPVSADDGATFSRFTLETPVTLAAGSMLSLPFLSEVLPDARLTLYRGGSNARHPDIALALTNPLPLRLPAGVLTLYEDGRGHAGDAMIPELAPGATETVRVGQDTAVEIREEVTASETVREIRMSRGVLTVTEDLERRVTYRLQGADRGDRVVTIDHPRASGWAVSAGTGPEERMDAWRWQVTLPEGGRETLVVTERQPRLRRLAVADMNTVTLQDWQGRTTDPVVRERLGQIAELRQEIAQAEQDLRRSEAQSAEREREQARLVNLIVQLGDDSAANRERRARVDAIDADLASASAERAALSDRIEGLRSRMASLIQQ
jgi:hypothetical protein